MALLVDYVYGDYQVSHQLGEWCQTPEVQRLAVAIDPAERFKAVYALQCVHFYWNNHDVYIKPPEMDSLRPDTQMWRSHSKTSDAVYPFVWEMPSYGQRDSNYRIIALQLLKGITSCHHHNETEEHFLSLSGETIISLDDDLQTIPQNKTLIVMPGTTHQLRSQKKVLFQLPEFELCVNLLLMIGPYTFMDRRDHHYN